MQTKHQLEKFISHLQKQTSLQTYQALKLLATEIPLHLPPAQNNLTPAAVLVPFILHEQNPSVLLTVRTSHLNHHAGQISFPGGKHGINEEAITCALRETKEEVGLNQVQVITNLGQWPSYSGYLIEPIVGLIHPPFKLAPNPHEVEEVFELPLSIAFDTTQYQRVNKKTPIAHHYFEVHYQNKRVWGFTASLLLLLATYAKTLA
ncbi:MAG: CoA pyrophosphatase [Proteobacteria bacterium]|nr:CoA pyrophosphatase [Pseudomonadota bacterium]